MRQHLIVEALRSRNIRPTSLANSVRVHSTTISDLLNEPNRIIGTTLAIKICAFLGLPMQDLFEDEIKSARASLQSFEGLIGNSPARKITRSMPCLVINDAMVEKGISPATLASQCSITRPYLSIILNSHRTISLRMAIKFAAILDITLDAIYAKELNHLKLSLTLSA